MERRPIELGGFLGGVMTLLVVAVVGWRAPALRRLEGIAEAQISG